MNEHYKFKSVVVKKINFVNLNPTEDKLLSFFSDITVGG